MINAPSIRGYPEQIRSDQGSKFTKADKELKEAIQEWNQHKINIFCRQKKIAWIFNPPSASHMGGAWERMIRSVRQILKAILNEQLVSDEVLQTVMAEAVSILNSRPLTRNSDSHCPLIICYIYVRVQTYHREYLIKMTSAVDVLGGKPSI